MENKLPIGWVWTRVGEACIELVGGGTPSRNNAEYFRGNIIWLTPTEIPKEKIIIINDSKEKITERGLRNSSARIIPKNSVLLTSRASIGYVAIAGCDLTTNQGFASFVCSSAIHNFYLAYWLWSNKDMLQANATGTTFKEIAKSKLREFFIPLPPLPEQHRIVAKIEELFTELDAGVEALKKVRAQLKRYRQAVLKYAFEGKSTEEWRKSSLLSLRGSKTTEAISRDGIATPSARNDNLPELPEGWVWTSVGELAEKIHYGYTASSTIEPTGPKMLRITDIQDNTVNWNTVPYCKIESEDKQKYLLRDGDLVFARTGATVGKSYLIRGKIPDAVFASYLIRIIISKQIKKEYVYNFFQSNEYWRQIHKGKLGIGQPNVNAQTLSQIILPLPPLPEQHKIVEEIERRFSGADEVERVVEQSLKQAGRLRQSILKRAFEGKLVPQDPNDEPAEKLLELIKSEKAKISLHKPQISKRHTTTNKDSSVKLKKRNDIMRIKGGGL